MPLTCPNCEGKRPRLSKIRGFKERLLSALGTYPVRCEDCEHRFYDSVLRIADMFFARCPRCYRMDLSTWELKYYSPTQWSLIKLAMGARRLRCEACRCNFASFRFIKERSTFRLNKSGLNSKVVNVIDHTGTPCEVNPDGSRILEPSIRDDQGNRESSDRIEVA